MSGTGQENGGIVTSLVSTNVLIASGILGALALVDFLLTPRLDVNEPPLLKPRVPLIGHIIGLLWHQYDYHKVLHNKYPVPIASLQMLWGKIYTIWDPQLAQASLRAKTLSFEPFVLEFAEKSFSLKRELLDKVMNTPGVVPAFTEAIHASMQPKDVHRMNVVALSYISQIFDKIQPGGDGGLEVSNLFEWVKEIITTATNEALFGVKSPFAHNPSLYDDIWSVAPERYFSTFVLIDIGIFEAGLTDLLTKPFPSITAGKAYHARNRLQRALGEYYEAQHDVNDPKVAELTRGRANALRRKGFSGMEVGVLEVMLPVVGTTNSVPMMYWMLCNIFAKPALIEKLREELLPLLERKEDDIIMINIARLEAECPLLVSCYRETLRLSNHNISVRRILEDTTITDENGRSYLLKKGVNVQIGGAVMHYDRAIWGDNAAEFVPERFLPATTTTVKTNESHIGTTEKTKKNAYIPFGGGRHYCPGRNFAFAEILAVSCALVLGFEFKSVGMAFDQMKPEIAKLGSATYKPRRGGEGLG